MGEQVVTVKCRLEITKGEPVRYISHLDYARTVERALRRAKLPVAYSEGFNPHMKMAFASALPVGVTSEAEYLDIEFADELSVETVQKKLGEQLPTGIALKRIQEITTRHKALMAVVNLAVFRVEVPLKGGEIGRDAAEAAVARFNAATTVPYIKISPKGKREIDVKNYIAAAAEIGGAGDKASLRLTIKITPTGSVKPGEVLEVLVSAFGFPADPAEALICRTALFAGDGAARISPIDIK